MSTSCTSPERRKKRSHDPLVALHYQLAHAKTDASLDALVLADSSGVVVAGAGAWAVCEELAAYAPILASTEHDVTLPSRMESLKGDLEVRTMHAAGQPMLLCALSSKGPLLSEERDLATRRCANGITRILETSP